MTPTAEAKRQKKRQEHREWRRRARQRAGTTTCECGCGEEIPAVRTDGKTPMRFAPGHSRRSGKPGQTKTDEAGYVLEYVLDEQGGRWERQHRLVWERAHGELPPGAHVHHVNGDKADNRPENLEALSAGEHADMHFRQRVEQTGSRCSDLEHMKRTEAMQRRPSNLTAEQVVEIRQRIAGGASQTEVGQALGIDLWSVHKVWTGKTWWCRVCEPQPPRPKRKPRPQAGGRTKTIILRVSPAEADRIRQNAEATGLTVSEYIRRRTCGELEVPAPVPQEAKRPQRGADFEARVRAYAKTMPRRNAELAVKREDAREKAKAALASG